ncbi:chromate ion family chromate transporter [Cupriavidus sp. USMAHM13]|uniref:Chromate ion family chromate transporter n=1 Tax=Cupriavidus malaysiensis TaxID=367825 RepID=A0ABM6F4T3_9BURK|nr:MULTISPECIES: chromate efflux transporter [Cupriavidus]AOY99793.1 chromate ion family chromate transporter [Cupriavidus sp. USMAHM13]AOZ06419.1 chromate ion family chromate transporter [Cupriavidus malaysiensis]
MLPPASAAPTTRPHGTAGEILAVFLKLGLTSFGGPVAHLGYFRREFVERRQWLSDEAFTDLVGLCQFLPGPASSQVGFSIGMLRAGWLGGLAAWCGFTVPSILLLLAFAAIAPGLGGALGQGLIHGLKLAAVAVVAQAVWDMARKLCPDHRRAAIALSAILLLSVLTTVYAQVIAIGAGAVLGLLLCRRTDGAGMGAPASPAPGGPLSRRTGILALALFCALLMLGTAPLLGQQFGRAAEVFDAFYRSGALVFGGGHVVLPLLQNETVATGWVSSSDFLAGYGAAQAVPGPLFTFAAYLGWMMAEPPHHLAGAALATAGIFLPGLLLVLAALPFWHTLRARPVAAAMMRGVNAAVVGLLASALYSPVWTSAVHTQPDFAAAAIAFVLLTRWKAPPLVVVLLCALAGIAPAAVG